MLNSNLSPGSWAQHFVDVFVPQIDAYCTAIANRVAPAFQDIDKEAEAFAQARYEELGSRSGSEWTDLADIADRVQDEAIIYYETLEGVRQGLINSAAVSLHHLFEQQLLLPRVELTDPSKSSVRRAKPSRRKASSTKAEHNCFTLSTLDRPMAASVRQMVATSGRRCKPNSRRTKGSSR